MKGVVWLFLTFIFCGLSLFAQSLSVQVIPSNSSDWNYKEGEEIYFDIVVTKDNTPLGNADISYELSYDMMPAFEKEKTILKDGKLRISAGAMDKPGFLRCVVTATDNNNQYVGMATAGHAPEQIVPMAEMPSDFLQFWENAIAENAKLPLDPQLKLLSERCTEEVDVYELNIQNFRHGSRLYGILCVPKAKGKYPAFLRLPGAGVSAFGGDVDMAKKGYVTLEIGIHGIPVTMDNHVYHNLANGALFGYQLANWDDRDKVYYKRAYLGCIKAIDYLFTRDEFDKENLIVLGGSQGGALAIVTSALDERVSALVSIFPALCDLTGYLHNRAGGWPHLFKDGSEIKCVLDQKVKVSGYYDVVNFARVLKTPGFYTFGYNDIVCPPTSMFSAYNSISAPKTLDIVPEVGHSIFDGLWDKTSQWTDEFLKAQNK